jgi:hypothetical protein
MGLHPLEYQLPRDGGLRSSPTRHFGQHDGSGALVRPASGLAHPLARLASFDSEQQLPGTTGPGLDEGHGVEPIGLLLGDPYGPVERAGLVLVGVGVVGTSNGDGVHISVLSLGVG